MITGRDVVCISSIEWDLLWQGPQEIAVRMAAAGNRVFYVENTGIRSPGLRDASRVRSRLRHWFRSRAHGGVREVSPNIFVLSPVVFPPFGSKLRRRVNRVLFLKFVGRTMRRLGVRDPQVWTYLPTDTALDLASMLATPRSELIYYCVADFAELVDDPTELRKREKELVEACDVVFVHVEELAELFRDWNPEVHVFPFGVDLDLFSLEETETDPGVAAVSRPVIGYVGGVHRHIDFQLMRRLARSRPEWSWVFVGPLQTSVEGLDQEPNVHFLGHRPHRELARLIRSMDVCIVPYSHNRYTETVWPIKINEYLALGKPVVSTDIPPVSSFNDEHQILEIATTSDEFIAAIERHLDTPVDPATVARRREVATLRDWGVQLEAMTDLIRPRPKHVAKQIRVVHVIIDLDRGGAEFVLLRLLERLSHDRFASEVISLTTVGEVGEEIQQTGIPVRALGWRGAWSSFVVATRLFTALRRSRPDVVQTWMYHGDLIGGLAAWLARSPAIAWGIHAGPLPPAPSLRVRLGLRAASLLSRWVPERIVCCSYESMSVHSRLGYSKEKMTLILNGFEAGEGPTDSRDLLLKELDLPSDVFVVGRVARLHPQKDHKTLLEAFALVHRREPRAHLVVAGAGMVPENQELTRDLARLGLNDVVHLLGVRDDTDHLNAAFDLAVSSSAFLEALPLVLGEAMAVATPVVTTDVGDSARLVGDSRYVVPPKDPAALAEAICSVIGLSEEARVELGRVQQQRVAREFGIDRMTEQYADLYEELSGGSDLAPSR